MWNDRFGPDQEPTADEIRQYINSNFWGDLSGFIENTYQVSPLVQYSQCSGQPGWNVKYKKGSRSLCTLYPMENFFIALVTIGNKEQVETGLTLPTCSPYLQNLYAKSASSSMGRWLMIEVREQTVFEDVKKLIAIRMQKRK